MKPNCTNTVVFLIALASTIGGLSAQTVTLDSGETLSCNRVFTPNVVRYGYYMGFFNNFKNTNTSTFTYFLNTFDVQYKNANYLASGGEFDFTPELKAQKHAVAPNQSIRAIATGDNNWRVVRHPAQRSTGENYDFMIAYKTTYDTSNNYPDTADDKSQVSCQPYQVSWCGDGVLDKEYETCDAGVENGLPGKCSSTCSTVNVPQPSICDKTFPTVVLRYGNEHNFNYSYTNLDSFDHRLRYFAINFDEPFDYNGSDDVPNFDWTTHVKTQNMLIPPGTNDLKIIQSNNKYTIKSIPPIRKADNLTIKYSVYVQNQNGGEAISHTGCQPYTISWCGDGVVDTEFGEPCDPAAEPWKSNGTCRVSLTNGSKCEVKLHR